MRIKTTVCFIGLPKGRTTEFRLPRPRDFAPAVIPSVHPLLNCRPTITVGETFHLIQNAGQS